jgi:AICAR transformylase/IMP cyclohydrolase PurH
MQIHVEFQFLDKDNLESYKSALACDPISAFGGIVSCNFKIIKISFRIK